MKTLIAIIRKIRALAIVGVIAVVCLIADYFEFDE